MISFADNAIPNAKQVRHQTAYRPSRMIERDITVICLHVQGGIACCRFRGHGSRATSAIRSDSAGPTWPAIAAG